MTIKYSMVIDSEPFFPARNYDCETLANWSVTYGRSDPDTQPDPGRGQWTIILDGGDRGPNIHVGAWVTFTADVDGTSLPVARMKVSEVSRSFTWVGGVQRNTITVNAEGVTVLLNRAYMGENDYLSGTRVTDGHRVYSVLGNVPAHTGRSPSTHWVNDDSNDVWPNPSRVVSTSWSGVQRKSGAHRHATAGTADVEITFTCDGPVDVGFQFLGEGWAPTTWRFMKAGTHRLQFEHAVNSVNGPTDVAQPFFRFRAEAGGSVAWSAAAPMGPLWQDAAPRWDAIGGYVEANVTVLSVDVWIDSWDWGHDLVEFRNPSTKEEAGSENRLDYIKSIGRAFRSQLWEMRDGTVYYMTRWARSKDASPELDLDACDVMQVAASTSNLSQIVNQVLSFWGLPDSSGNRQERSDVDTVSKFWFGEQEWKNDGPLHTEAQAKAIADWVIASHKDPHEDLPSLTLVPFESMDPLLVVDLLRLTPGSMISLVNTPAGWVSSPQWFGFMEGSTITGEVDSDGVQRTTMQLALSDFTSVAGAPPPIPVQPPIPTGNILVNGANFP